MHRFNSLPCALIDAAAIVALHHMTPYDLFTLAVVSDKRVRVKIFPLGDFVIQPCNTVPYHIGEGACGISLGKHIHFEINDTSYIIVTS